MIPAQDPPTILSSQPQTIQTTTMLAPDISSLNISDTPSPRNQPNSIDLNKSQIQQSQAQKVNLEESMLKPESSNIDAIEDSMIEKQERQYIPPEFYYEEGHKEVQFENCPIEEAVAEYHHTFGFDSFKKNNIQILDKDNIIYASGTTYTIYNTFTCEARLFFSQDRGGIGCIAVHPSKKYFAVAEKGQYPNIYIYEYPLLRLYRIMRKGTERSYSKICFNAEGNNLASVGSKPDYQICVWDWLQQVILLKAKAFSQEVYNVSFCHFNEAALITSGMGHIKFWKVSQTFTGLKLQGQIAKFGQIELSDVSAYIDFEDGKVLSSSEYGKLLLWEGNLIKSVISIDEETLCHNGAIQVIILFKKQIVSAGVDGYVRFWDYDTINNSESNQQFNFYLKPTHEIYFERQQGLPAHIVHIVEHEDMWIVQDALGKIWKLKTGDFSRTEIMQTNSGKLNNMVLSPIANVAVTVGSDGYVRVWDYGNKTQFYCRNFLTRSEASAIEWIPYSKKNAGRMIAVGFGDGLIRFLLLNQSGIELVTVFKIHKKRIIHIKCSPDGVTLVVIDETGDIFLCSLNSGKIQDIVPYCLYQTGFKINDVCWDRDSTKILLGCKDGNLAEIKVLRPQQCDNSQTYLKPHNARTYLVKMMESQKPKKQDLELELLLKKTRGVNVDDKIVDEEWQPSPVLSVLYYDNECNKVLCSVDGKFLGHLYIVDWSKDRPIGSIKINKQQISHVSINDQVLILGFSNGSFQLRHKYNYDKYLLKFPHDRDIGKISKVAFNHEKNSLITTSQDGTIFVYKIDYGSFCRAAKSYEPLEIGSIMIPSSILGLNEVSFIDKLETDEISDIKDSSGYSIQEEKLKAEEDNKMSEADKIKLTKRRKIKELQATFNQILATNNKQTDEIVKLSNEQLVVDPEYVDILRKQVQDQIQQTTKQLQYDQTYSKLLKDKIQDYMINQLQYDKFIVLGIKKDSLAVQSFKLKKMSEYMKIQLQKINRIIQQQKFQQANPNKRNSIDTIQMMQMTRNSFNKTGGIGMSNANITGKGKDFHGKIRQAEQDFEKELQHAQMTKGDYKLKSSKDYNVPENQRLNITRKKKHMFVHYNYLFTSKKQFNERLTDLKNRKQKIIEKILKFNKIFEDINQQLGIEEALFTPKVQNDQDLEITNQEIEEFARVKKAKENKRGSVGGMGGAGGETAPVVVEKIRKKSLFLNRQQIKEKQSNKPRKGMKVQTSQLQTQLKQINEIRLISQKSRMNKQLDQQISEFDKDLNELKLTKSYLQIDLRQIQMKLITEYQQYLIFGDMQDEDNKLLERLHSLKQDKITFEITSSNLMDQIAEIQALTEDLKHKVDQQKKVFKQLVFPDDDEKRDKILRYYKNRERKRLNKARRQNEKEKNQHSEEQSEQNLDEEDSDQDDQDNEDDEFDEDEEKPDITPIETDHKNFDLIRKICEHDEKIDENTRMKNDLQKQKNQIGGKIKGMLTQLLKVDTELKVLQKKKLVKINLLDVTYPISISQINHLVKVGNTYTLPEDLNSSIMFTAPSYDKLANRIKELKKEKVDIEKKQLTLEKQLGRLKNQVKKAAIDIQNKRKEEEEKQLLKFGDTIDLKILEALEPTKQLLDTRQRYKLEEKQVSKRIQHIKHELQLRKKDLLTCKKQNTKVITEITELGEKQMQLNKKLDSTNKQLFRGEDEDKKNDMDKEKSNLKDLIKFLSKEIEDLKTEIGLFKRKGGHIYTMVTSNKRNFT